MQSYQTIKWSKTKKTTAFCSKAPHFFSAAKFETNQPSGRFEKPHLPMTSSWSSESLRHHLHCAPYESVARFRPEEIQDARQPWVRSEMVDFCRGKNTIFPPTSLAAYGISNPTSYSNPCEISEFFHLYSPTCSWSLHYGPFPLHETLASLWLKPSLRR